MFLFVFYLLSMVCFAGGEGEAFDQLLDNYLLEIRTLPKDLKLLSAATKKYRDDLDKIISGLKAETQKGNLSDRERFKLNDLLGDTNQFKRVMLRDLGKAHLDELRANRTNRHLRLNALTHLNEAVELGDAHAAVLLAKEYEVGLITGIKDCQTARKFYVKAAQLGDSFSQYRLAEIILNGDGCEQVDKPDLFAAKYYLQQFLDNKSSKKKFPKFIQEAHSQIKVVEQRILQEKNECLSPDKSFEGAKNLSVSSGQIVQNISGETKASVIQSCCKSVATGQIPVDSFAGNPPVLFHNYIAKAFDPALDPYSSGYFETPPPSFKFGYTDKKYFHFDKSGISALGASNQIPEAIPYRIPEKNSGESDQAYYSRRLSEELKGSIPPGKNVHEIVTKAGEGTQSQVYWVHDPIPSDSQLKSQYPDEAVLKLKFPGFKPAEARRQLWASLHSKEVLKLRTPTPWEIQGEEGRAKAVQQARRDLAMEGVFEMLSKRFSVVTQDGQQHPLVEVVKYKNAAGELGRGVFRQEATHGETAYQISSRIKKALQGDKTQESYLVNHLGFATLEDAKLHINALENFYRETHNDAYNFQEENDLMGPGGFTLNGNVASVGFDYGLGRNVIWDSKKKIFRAFDL